MRKRVVQILFTVLVISLFLANFAFQYLAIALLFSCRLLDVQTPFKKDKYLFWSIGLVGVSLLSYVYNIYKNEIDPYTILFWVFSYLPPLLLIVIISSYKNFIDPLKIYKFYKAFVVFEALLIIIKVFQYKTLVVGDPATGTVGDANFVAFHVCVVIIYELVYFIKWTRERRLTGLKKYMKMAEIFFWFIVLLIPESSANVGFMAIIIGLIVIDEYVIKKINFLKLTMISLLLMGCFFIFSKTFVYNRFVNVSEQVDRESLMEDNLFFTKLRMYNYVFTGKIYKDVNFLIGYGPSTFTSRSSVVRMPEERVNSIPFDVPYYRSPIYKKYIADRSDILRESSFGNFSSPQTTIISVAVELGLLGLVCLTGIIVTVWKENKKFNHNYIQPHLFYFVKYLTIFYIFNLFLLNFWEYPIITFTYFIFAIGFTGNRLLLKNEQ